MQRLAIILAVLLSAAVMLCGCGSAVTDNNRESSSSAEQTDESYILDNIPEYTGSPYVALYDNQPQFSSAGLTEESYETYAPLDDLGRCGVAVACVGKDIMPTEERGNIGSVKPSGWVTSKYDFVDGRYLYNRCHLIGFQLTGENANEQNLITGTRYMNVEGMLPFENMIADYVKETDNHVLYRVTPVFEGNNLVASGVQLEAFSVEDKGDGICFNVYVYNVQPGVEINYLTGENWEKADEGGSKQSEEEEYVLNINSKKFHKPNCSSVKDTKEENRQDYTGSREKLISNGYSPCGSCKP